MMKKKKLAIVILGAGKGERMKSKKAKVLHLLAGRPMIEYTVDLAESLHSDKIVLVVGYQGDRVKLLLADKKIDIVEQKEQLGTAHAIIQSKGVLKNFKGNILVLSGDVPLLKKETLIRLLKEHDKLGSVVTVLTARIPEPYGYGRVLRKKDSSIEKIVEEGDATKKERRINEINSGIYCFKKDFLFNTLQTIKRDNVQKEFYLTDIIEIARKRNLPVHTLLADDSNEIMGINTRVDLANIEQTMRKNILSKLMLNGVTIIDPSSTFIDSTVNIGKDTIIYPHTQIYGNTKIGEDCVIMSHSVIINSSIAHSVEIKGFVFITESTIGNNAKIGPFTHFRPETILKERVKIGNFVEIKKSVVGMGSKAPHLTYIGDSTIGKKVNIGAGTITCNYDGREKHQTIINDGVFVGSDTQFVAPIKVGKGAYIAAGTTVTKDVPPYSLTLSRADQINKENWVLQKIKEEKGKKDKKEK